MNSSENASLSMKLLVWTRAQLSELEIGSSVRNRCSAGCFAISHEHHRAILNLLLLDFPAVASAYALVRPQFESYMRGLWLLRCASETQVAIFDSGGNPPNAKAMATAVAATGAFEGTHLLETYNSHWKFMSAYVHTGAQQVSRWDGGEVMAPQYNDDEISQVIQLSEMISVFTGVAVAVIAESSSVASSIAERSMDFKELRSNPSFQRTASGSR